MTSELWPSPSGLRPATSPRGRGKRRRLKNRGKERRRDPALFSAIHTLYINSRARANLCGLGKGLSFRRTMRVHAHNAARRHCSTAPHVLLSPDEPLTLGSSGVPVFLCRTIRQGAWDRKILSALFFYAWKREPQNGYLPHVQGTDPSTSLGMTDEQNYATHKRGRRGERGRGSMGTPGEPKTTREPSEADRGWRGATDAPISKYACVFAKECAAGRDENVQ